MNLKDKLNHIKRRINNLKDVYTPLTDLKQDTIYHLYTLRGVEFKEVKHSPVRLMGHRELISNSKLHSNYVHGISYSFISMNTKISKVCEMPLTSYGIEWRIITK